MKKYCFAVVSIFISTFLPSQTLSQAFKIIEGPVLEMRSACEFITELPSGYLFQRQTGLLGTKVELVEFNENMEYVRGVEMDELSYKKNKAYFAKVIRLGSNYYVFYATKNKKTRQSDLVWTKMDPLTLKPSGPFNYITTVSVNYDMNSTDVYLLVNTNFQLISFIPSQDDSSLTIVSTDHPNTLTPLSDSMPIHVVRYNSEMEQIFQCAIPFRPSSRLFTVKEVVNSSTNRIAILGIEFINEAPMKGKRSDSSQYRFHCFSVRPDGKQFISVHDELKIPDGSITDLKLLHSDQNTISFFGYYSVTNKKTHDGTLYIRLNTEDLKINKISKNPLPENFVSHDWEIEKGRRVNSKTKTSKRMSWEMIFREPFFLEDGSILVINEEYRQYFAGYGTNGTSTYPLIYDIYNDIIITRIDSAGQISWTKKISKCQGTLPSYFISSFISFNQDQQLHFIFNEDARNTESSNTVAPYYNDHEHPSFVRHVGLDYSGNFSYSSLFNNQPNTLLSSELYGFANSNEIITWSKTGGEVKLVKIKIGS